MHTFNLPKLAADITNYRHEVTAATWMRGRPLPLRICAEQANTTASTIHRAELAKAVPDMRSFLLLCAWMGKRPADYFTVVK